MPGSWDIAAEVRAAEARIRDWVRETPLVPSPALSDRSGAEVFLKLENRQWTGSFKYRGAVSKLLSLDEPARKAPIVTASTGNHGLAVARALDRLGRTGTIYLARNAAPRKMERLRRHGVRLKLVGADSVEAERHARRVSRETGAVYISPYNDPAVVGGQGTVGLEIARQSAGVDAILVAVGGGGLIAGIAGFLKTHRPGTRVIGCLPSNSPVMYESVRAGRVVDMPVLPTLSDGTAGGIESDSITFEPCRALVDDWVLAGEEEIRGAIRLVHRHHQEVIEGSAGVAVAALLKHRERLRGKRVAVVICGGNIDPEEFAAITAAKNNGPAHR